MRIKKAKNTSGGAGKETCADCPMEEKPANAVEGRQKVAKLIVEAAPEIANALIGAAKQGQLAPAKYLFEIAGLYPAIEQTEEQAEEGDPLARMLLSRLELAAGTMTLEEYPAAGSLDREAREAKCTIIVPAVAERNFSD